MRVINKTGASSVEHPPGSGAVYEAEDDGVFDMPENIAHELTTRHAAHWALESAHEASLRRQRTAKLRSPREAADTITRHDSQLAALTARVAELEARVPEIEHFFGQLVETELEPAQSAPGGEQLATAPPAQEQSEQQDEDAGGELQDGEQHSDSGDDRADGTPEEPKTAAKRTSPRKAK